MLGIVAVRSGALVERNGPLFGVSTADDPRPPLLVDREVHGRGGLGVAIRSPGLLVLLARRPELRPEDPC